ncbi:hypothetical protein C900_02400 [Fulvivirga imtechensis AK7]|uniref:HEAT repeat domain-containing protein n=1 Tax=Fulvivirga imtechensis AK7 TaxID=1237149 RepID=L8JVM3_9BACT|nr:hypothetical protein [Fulvivirga imtechensis]ELR71664.1 hypothetical protein C900_02400 [Fulvivirga imtechensis AK7]
MNFEEIITDKAIKPKEKTEALSRWLANNPLELERLISYAEKAKDPVKASCIEAIEYVTKDNPQIVTVHCCDFLSAALTEDVPRIKWESARVIGNIAHLFPDRLEVAVKNLLQNSDHKGTVVRWSTAYALVQIIKTKQWQTSALIGAMEAIAQREEKASIRKIYLTGLKGIKK